MNRRKLLKQTLLRSPHSLLIMKSAIASLYLCACTNVELYKWRNDPYQANKLTVSGRVCTDDPHQRNFPVKILFVVDVSQAMMAEKNDNHGFRGRAISEIIDVWGKSENYRFGIIAFGAKARNHIDAGFTRDTALLTSAVAAVSGNGGITGP